jgi:hypothetical protein
MISWGILSRASVQVLARSLLESQAIAFITSLFSRRVQLLRCLLCISFDVGEIGGGEPCALCIDDSATRVANDYSLSLRAMRCELVHRFAVNFPPRVSLQ